MLDPKLQAQVADALTRLVGPIDLVAAVDGSEAGRQLGALLADLAAASPQITVINDPDPGARRPGFGVARRGEAPRVRFAGVPLGHEFTSLVLALLHVSGVPPRIDAAALDAARALPELELETYVSLSCQNCPDVVQALNAVAAVNPRVRHTMIDGAVFPDEVEARGIRGVPAVLRDGALVSSGRATLDALLATLGVAVVDDVGERAPYDVLVVGGGPAGASAALYAVRKGLRTGIVAERAGGQLGDTLGIENLVSVAYTEGPKLAAELQRRVSEAGVERVEGQRVTRLVPAPASGGLHEVELARGATLRARTVVLAPGARWRELGVPGEAAYRTKGVAFCPHCDGPLFRGKDVAVVGGGNSGVEAAIDLAGLARRVTLLEFGDALRADAVLQRKLRSLPNVEVHTGARTVEITGDGAKVDGLVFERVSGGGERKVYLDGVFVQIGLVPNTGFLDGTVALSPRGEIEVDARGATSVPGVFAAGDATTVPYKQIVIAMGDGAKASLSAFDHLVRTSVAAA